MNAPDDGSTERIARLEAELRQRTEQLVRAKAELVDFASVAAHDLRSPLLTISGYCDLLLREHRGQLDESADHYLRSIVDGVARMNRLIADLSGYAQLRCSGRPTGAVELDRVLADVRSNLDGAIRQSEATLDVDSLPRVRGNHNQLIQVFQNLIDNAIKFRGPDPPVVRISSSPESGGHVVRVSDNGVGIAAEHQEVVFQLLYRLPKTRHLPGIGIGLAVCRKILECHEGRIWIESRPGEGATFLVWLPAAE
jgi:light-regulated signal transduction histidine kinase (bacteriophytochrome)